MTIEKELGDSLRQMGWNGYIGFSVKAKDNEVNNSIHEAFKEFSKIEAQNDHTLAIKMLLTCWEDTARIDAVWDYMKHLEQRIVELETKTTEPKKEEKEEEMF